MEIPSYMTVIEQLFTLLDQVLKDYIYNGYSALSNHLRYPLGLAVILYVMIMGISISQGWVKLSMSNFVKAAFKIGLIYMFAMNWSTFSDYVVKGIEGSAGQIGDWLVSASPIPLPHFAGEGINGALQSVLIEITKVGAWTWDMGSFHNWGPFFTAMAIWAFGYIALVLAIVEIVLAKMMLALFFTLAPLFISFTLFKPTQGMFDRWLGSIGGFALFLVFIPAAIALLLNFMQWTIAGQYAEHAIHMSLVGFVPLMIVSILGVILILYVTDYARNIGGSISSASGSALLAGTVGGFIGGTLSSLSFAARPFRGKGSSSDNPATKHIESGLKGAGSKESGSSIMDGIRHRLRRGE